MSLTLYYSPVEGPTSSFESAHQLGKLCENRHLLVNLIPYNQTDVKDKLKCPSEEHMGKFQDILASYKVVCTIRRTMGADIGSACGQLVVQKKQQEEQAKSKQLDIEDASGASAKKMSTKGIAAKRSTPSDSSEPEDDHLDLIIKRLAIVTGLAATCFVVASILFLTQKGKRRG
jgi:sorting nexin-8